jgi:hypothetical protein
MSEHPDELTWERLACRELPEGERARVMAHVVECGSCARTWRAVREMTAEARRFDPGVPGARTARRVAPWIVAAGGVVAMAAALLLVLRPREPGGAEDLRAAREAEVFVVDAAGLRWQPVAGADSYRVRVFAADGSVAWSAPPSPSLQAARPELPAGAYTWEVEALRGGEVIARSRITPLR